MTKTTLNGKTKYEIIKVVGDSKIVKAYANDDNGMYGDIYTTLLELQKDYPGENYLNGYMILNNHTEFCPDESKCFYETVAEAEKDINSNFNEESFK